jgi:hypothetical protein
MDSWMTSNVMVEFHDLFMQRKNGSPLRGLISGDNFLTSLLEQRASSIDWYFFDMVSMIYSFMKVCIRTIELSSDPFHTQYDGKVVVVCVCDVYELLACW